MVGGNGISWTIRKSFESRSRQITTPAPHHSISYRPDALPDAQPTVSKCWRQLTLTTISSRFLTAKKIRTGSVIVLHKNHTSPPHHKRFTALFRDHPGEPVPEENFWTLWCKGRLTEAETPTIRLGATPSGLTSANLHHPLIFYRPDACFYCRPAQPTVLVHGQVTIIFVVSVGLSVCLFVCLCRVCLSRL